MGEVWRGRDTRLDRSVAIKILPPASAKDEERRLKTPFAELALEHRLPRDLNWTALRERPGD